jgi:hypothetical protein
LNATAASRNRAWGIAIVAGLVVAAALIVIPRQTVFESKGRDVCEDIGQQFTGLASESGRYSDPVPDGANCVGLTDPSTTEVEVNFFATSNGLDSTLAWLYRLVCIIAPLTVALALGFRLSRAR